MPYIPEDRQDELFQSKEPGYDAENVGELTYIICDLVDDYLLRHGISYQRLAEAHAALGNSDKEIYRRITAPYEDKKIFQNGDIFSENNL